MKTLTLKMTPTQDVVKDILLEEDEEDNDMDISKYLSDIFKYSMNDELKRVGRRISKVKNPYKLILEVKTAKK